MWPWGHAAVGYLVYTLARRRAGARPAGTAVVALAVGTQFPDLVDKPLAWTWHVLPGGRTLTHSLLTVAVVAAAVRWLARRYRRREVGSAFLVGYVAHPFADGLYPAVRGEFGDLTFLLWPIYPTPEPEIARSFWAHFAVIDPSPTFLFELLLVVVAVVAWNADGRPGLGVCRRGAVRGVERLRAAVAGR